MTKTSTETIGVPDEPPFQLVTGFPPVYERLSFRIHQLGAQLARVCNAMFRQYGIDLVSSRIMVLVLELGPSRAGTIVDAMMLPQSTISYQLQRLEKLGYLERSRQDEDQRIVTVTLTPTGRLVADACEKLSFNVYAALVDGMSPEVLQMIGGEVTGMLGRLQQLRGD